MTLFQGVLLGMVIGAEVVSMVATGESLLEPPPRSEALMDDEAIRRMSEDMERMLRERTHPR